MDIKKNIKKFKEELSMEKYTRQDAIIRLLPSQTGSLTKERIPLSYLNSLEIQLQNWLDRISEARIDLLEKFQQ